MSIGSLGQLNSFDMKNLQWYALRVRGGREEKVRKAIEEQVAEQKLEEYIGKMQIPYEKTYAVKGGKSIMSKRYFPYIMVEANIKVEELKELLANTEHVLGFISTDGWGKKVEPIALQAREVGRMFTEEQGTSSMQAEGLDEMELKSGDEVEITEGVFKGSKAKVQEANNSSKRVKIVIRMFKTDTTVELNFNQVKKI